MNIQILDHRDLPVDQVLNLYRAVGWSCADRPEQLIAALENSHSVLSAWSGETMVGLGNAISDGHLVVYYPHLLVQPGFQNRGIGKQIIVGLTARYQGFHQQVLVAEPAAIGFYEKCGFEPSGSCQSMWIYKTEPQATAEIRVEMPQPLD